MRSGNGRNLENMMDAGAPVDFHSARQRPSLPGDPVLIWLAGHIDEPVLGRRYRGALSIPGVGRVPETYVLRTQRADHAPVCAST